MPLCLSDDATLPRRPSRDKGRENRKAIAKTGEARKEKPSRRKPHPRTDSRDATAISDGKNGSKSVVKWTSEKRLCTYENTRLKALSTPKKSVVKWRGENPDTPPKTQGADTFKNVSKLWKNEGRTGLRKSGLWNDSRIGGLVSEKTVTTSHRHRESIKRGRLRLRRARLPTDSRTKNLPSHSQTQHSAGSLRNLRPKQTHLASPFAKPIRFSPVPRRVATVDINC